MVIWFGCLLPAIVIADNTVLNNYLPEGFGAVTHGGEGGKIITVTNLADSGPGSLREALMAQEPRIVQFSVEGTIELNSRIKVTNGKITIDGSTAPEWYHTAKSRYPIHRRLR